MYWLPWSVILWMFCAASRAVPSLSNAILKDLTPCAFLSGYPLNKNSEAYVSTTPLKYIELLFIVGIL